MFDVVQILLKMIQRDQTWYPNGKTFNRQTLFGRFFVFVFFVAFFFNWNFTPYLQNLHHLFIVFDRQTGLYTFSRAARRNKINFILYP